ncbi:uncharacterized protein [Maniola hyperantus]|uniref:uncharacterized protein isoform X2 n=1 Tax=Aphantopus hyperantus TaxID=2795564 RepID=UPI00374A43D4
MTYPNTSTRSFMLEIVSECKSTTSTGTIPEVNIISTDKEVTASSSNIDLFTKMNTADSLIGSNSKDDVGNDNQISKKLTENKNIGNSNVKSERTSKRTHRCKVRSPKRKGPEIEKNICQKKSIGVDAVDWGDDLLIEEKNEIKVQVLKQVTEVAANTEEEERLMVDFFGIMIMTPIAVVAAGLTGRTFAGLMAQDQLTPWPLASTFVLACMTLVCYYCWIVSALTRHALGWWIWYRSHYEVRLQIPEEGEHSQDSIANHLY